MTLLNYFKVGNIIEVIETENVIHRFPNLIGEKGVIVTAPCHPSTWYAVRIFSTESVVKLQPTAMRIAGETKVSKVDAKKCKYDVGETALQDSSLSSPLIKARSNSYVSNIADLQENSKVMIIGTENVLSRLPHLVGCVGTIVGVPVHPATWFKVEFSNGQIATFRPSALKFLSDSDSGASYDQDLLNDGPGDRRSRSIDSIGSDNQSVESLRSSSISSTPQSLLSPSAIMSEGDSPMLNSTSIGLSYSAISSSGRRISRTKRPCMLSMHDPELWTGSIVRVQGGKHHEEEGRILRSGNGWVQIATFGGEELSKRAHELELVTCVSKLKDDIGLNTSNERADCANNSCFSVSDEILAACDSCEPQQFSFDSVNKSPLLEANGCSNSAQNSRSSRVNSSSSSLSFQSNIRRSNATCNNNVSNGTILLNNDGHSRSRSISTDSIEGSSKRRVSFDASCEGRMDSNRPTSEAICPFPLKPEGIRTLEKERIRKLVEKQQENRRLSIDFRAWKSLSFPSFIGPIKDDIDAEYKHDRSSFNGVLKAYQPAKNLDQYSDEFNGRDIRYQPLLRFVDACPCCRLEKWPGAEFCWNTSCSLSPIYLAKKTAQKSSNQDDEDEKFNENMRKERKRKNICSGDDENNCISLDDSDLDAVTVSPWGIKLNPVTSYLWLAPCRILESMKHDNTTCHSTSISLNSTNQVAPVSSKRKRKEFVDHLNSKPFHEQPFQPRNTAVAPIMSNGSSQPRSSISMMASSTPALPSTTMTSNPLSKENNSILLPNNSPVSSSYSYIPSKSLKVKSSLSGKPSEVLLEANSISALMSLNGRSTDSSLVGHSSASISNSTASSRISTSSTSNSDIESPSTSTKIASDCAPILSSFVSSLSQKFSSQHPSTSASTTIACSTAFSAPTTSSSSASSSIVCGSSVYSTPLTWSVASSCPSIATSPSISGVSSTPVGSNASSSSSSLWKPCDLSLSDALDKKSKSKMTPFLPLSFEDYQALIGNQSESLENKN